MRWALIAFVTLGTAVLLWWSGLLEEFLGPWAAWANFIGYFQ